MDNIIKYNKLNYHKINHIIKIKIELYFVPIN